MRTAAYIPAILLLLLVAAQAALACPVCYGAKDSPMTAGMNDAILVMLGIVGIVLLLIVAAAIVLWRRYRRYQRTISDTVFVGENGVLQTKQDKGVVEWNIF